MEYVLIQQNYDALDKLAKDIENDIIWFIDTKKKVSDDAKRIEEIFSDGFESLDDAKINDIVANKIETNEINAIQQAFDAKDGTFKLKPSIVRAKEIDIKTAQKNGVVY